MIFSSPMQTGSVYYEASFSAGQPDGVVLVEEAKLDYGDALDPTYPTLLPIGASHARTTSRSTVDGPRAPARSRRRTWTR